jgi:hypothetical protein
MMRVWAAVGVMALAVSLSSCGLTFDVHADGEAKVPGGGILGSFFALPGLDNFASFDISQTQDFKNQGVSKDHLESVKLKSIVMKVKDPAGGNFNFIDKIQFFAQLPNDDSSKVQIAHKDSVPRDTNQFNLDIDNVELLKYVVAPSMKITTSASGRSPAQDTTITVNVIFDVDPKL